ncbi:hypothetical protein B0J17DRAFT_683850 [Rhizoctonia solani]|nr:hypothetical protein B0J17DRAFT_683850 [Rhizoctonia solani]
MLAAGIAAIFGAAIRASSLPNEYGLYNRPLFTTLEYCMIRYPRARNLRRQTATYAVSIGYSHLLYLAGYLSPPCGIYYTAKVVAITEAIRR